MATTSEPDFGPFEPLPVADLARWLAPGGGGPPTLVAVDGRSGSGKSTLARALAEELGAVVVATDDVAWHLHPTAWAAALLQGVVGPWFRGRPVRYVLPGWIAQGRDGAIEVPAGADLVVEGVGAGRRELAPFARAVVWVASDEERARRRGIERDVALGRDPAEAQRFWDEWMTHEQPFLERERPWTRAEVVVDGTADVPPGTVRVAVPGRRLGLPRKRSSRQNPPPR